MRLVGVGAWKGGEGRLLLLRPLAWDWVLADAMEEAGEQARAEVGREEARSCGALLGAEAEALCLLIWGGCRCVSVRLFTVSSIRRFDLRP